MSIQWYPGHMTKARRAIAESMPSQDVIIEVLDARMPRASENPAVAELRGQKPCIKVLNKSDLADPAVTKAWLRHLEAEHPAPSGGAPAGGQVLAIAISASQSSEARRRIPELCKRLAPPKNGPGKVVRAMIVGIPNVGKSTLINTLMERKVAKVGDEPAVTKSRQLVTLKSGMAISDNPGILWPKIDDEAASFRLAVGGAIPDTAIDYQSVAHFAAGYFLRRYPELLAARYKLTDLPTTAAALIEEIGRRRGCLRGGGSVDLHKASDILVHDFRAGRLGRISLEEPPGLEEPSGIEESA
ncbi:ribosome biogenesis GTPase YlqF [Sorangium cellulosum]|uniref:Ribosome biogenesis GTPase A n=1 Tax=Sorangium cellulosum TaxID=56 RepID=A0A150QET0_SORCE|nr:ribosome biogenesis GTPase YlqF [Sorangium cellulosum]KYF66451.1 ribosome biogenesis GTPase YlqF [Sorangium cellulosum]